MHSTHFDVKKDESRPEKDDFYSFDKATLHGKPLHETHWLSEEEELKEAVKTNKSPKKANEWMPFEE